MEKINHSIKLKNDLNDLNKIKEVVGKLTSSIYCPKKKCMEIDLVLEELFVNVVHYAFNDDKEHEIKLSLTMDENVLTIQLEDDGKPFDITAATSPDTKCALEKRCVGGLGIHFVKHFTNDSRYYRKNGKNVLILKKEITDDDQCTKQPPNVNIKDKGCDE